MIHKPTVTAVPTVKYIVRWSFEGFDGEDVQHHKTYLSKLAAYRHAAWAYLLDRRSKTGCDRNKCAVGKLRYINQYGDMSDDRCRYCNTDKAYKLANRLARLLMRRDRLAEAKP